MKSDAQLLTDYAQRGEEAAFGEIVRRHTNLVYSAALRQTESAAAAAEIAQCVFVDLSRRAGSLVPRLQVEASLAGWLCRSARNQAVNLRRNEFRRHARERLAMEQLHPASECSPDWEPLRSVLDAAMAELPEADYDAIVLRFFQNQDFRTVGRALGVTDDTAQKRVSRALDKLREQLTSRGVTTTATALSIAITANAVQAAPVGLTLTISAAAAVTGTAAAVTTTTATITKSIAMTTLQKALITTASIAAIGTGVYEAHKATTWEARAQTLKANASQVEELQRQRDEAVAAQTTLQEENQRLAQAAAEVPRLRGDLARMRGQEAASAASNSVALDSKDPLVQHFLEAKATADKVAQYLEQMPEKKIPEIQFLDDRDWFNVSRWAKFDTDIDVRKTLSQLRRAAKDKLPMGRSLYAFVHANNGQLPTEMSQLKPYIAKAVTDSSYYHWRGVQSAEDDVLLDSVLSRYEILLSGNVNDYPEGTWFIAEKSPVDKEYDTQLKSRPATSTFVWIGEAAEPHYKN